MYVFSEEQIRAALNANGFSITYGDNWKHRDWGEFGCCSLKEAFEMLLRERNIL